MTITPEATGVPVTVQAGDFVTFPDGKTTVPQHTSHSPSHQYL